MKLITKEIQEKLDKNMTLAEEARRPVLKLFGGAATWLISEKEGDTLFGLCDLGMGHPELGYVSFEELQSVKVPPFGLGIERDMYWAPDKTLAEYATEAGERGFLE